MENVEELKLTRWDIDSSLTFEELITEPDLNGDQHLISH